MDVIAQKGSSLPERPGYRRKCVVLVYCPRLLPLGKKAGPFPTPSARPCIQASKRVFSGRPFT